MLSQIKGLDDLNIMCCSSCHIGDDGAGDESNKPHQPT